MPRVCKDLDMGQDMSKELVAVPGMDGHMRGVYDGKPVWVYTRATHIETRVVEMLVGSVGADAFPPLISISTNPEERGTIVYADQHKMSIITDALLKQVDDVCVFFGVNLVDLLEEMHKKSYCFNSFDLRNMTFASGTRELFVVACPFASKIITLYVDSICHFEPDSRFTSVDTYHNCLTARGDLEALGYFLRYVMVGLPWETAESDHATTYAGKREFNTWDKLDGMGADDAAKSAARFCPDHPVLEAYFAYVWTLSAIAVPDYAKIRQILDPSLGTEVA